MKRQWKRIPAAALTFVLMWNQTGICPEAWASSTPDMVVEEVEELPDSVLYQTVPCGTPYEELEFPDELTVLLEESEEPGENSADEDGVETATVSDAKGTAVSATSSDAGGATLSDADADSETNGDWQTVKVSWVLNTSQSVASPYSGEVPG